MDANSIIQQSKTAAELGDLILQEFRELLTTRKDDLTSTDRATIVRFLMQNGWTVDPKNIPEELKGMLTSEVKFDDTDDLPLRMVK
jgi:hypothetical protein